MLSLSLFVFQGLGSIFLIVLYWLSNYYFYSVQSWVAKKITQIITSLQGWRQEFSDGGLTLPTRGLKYGFYGTINAKNLRKNHVLPFDGGLACSDGGL